MAEPPYRKEVSIMNKKDLFIILNIPDDGTFTVDNFEYDESGNTKYFHISRPPSPTFCPDCGCIMHSKGIKKRTAVHPVMQDGSRIVLKISQRRWKCTGCDESFNESFPFISRYKRYSSVTPILILNAMKDINRSAASVAQQFFLSDTEIHDIFSQYVDLKRLPLPEYISVDEVYMDIDEKNLYAFVIMDFVTGEIVDIVHNRWSSTLEDYFRAISKEERKNVKAVISDAYGPYQNLCERFFPNAQPILDSFHVVKYINQKLILYVNELLKRYRKKQEKEREEKNEMSNTDFKTLKDSQEIVLLRDYRWVILKNKNDISYSYKRHYQKKLYMYLDTYQVEKMFFDIDPSLKKMRDLKELYITFNRGTYSSNDEIRKALASIISIYKNCEFEMFNEFADMLDEFTDNIIRSFTSVKCIRKNEKDQDDYYARLSNGPMEGFNRKPKDYKRNSRGFSNFDYTRNRILWATRINPPILAVPKSLKHIHIYHKKKKNKQ